MHDYNKTNIVWLHDLLRVKILISLVLVKA
nr:MAG TPA: hypothetical protein [Bacteriophage sp.]